MLSLSDRNLDSLGSIVVSIVHKQYRFVVSRQGLVTTRIRLIRFAGWLAVFPGGPHRHTSSYRSRCRAFVRHEVLFWVGRCDEPSSLHDGALTEFRHEYFGASGLAARGMDKERRRPRLFVH
jgi:hypothetical protein